MLTRTLTRWTLAGALAVTVALLTLPAAACGCGIYIPQEGDASVAEERALIRWESGVEEIVMELGVQGGSAEAAWILPVPAPATVKLGDAKLFDALQDLTRPRLETRYTLLPEGFSLGLGGGAPGGSPPVTVLGRQTLGPFDVSSLAATDSHALSDWLTANGYTFPEGMAEVLQAYVDEGWYYVAIRLKPAASGEKLTGQLDPLWVTFNSNSIVYPMRATALAKSGMPVFLYVIADHRVEKEVSFGSSHVSFADWIEPTALGADSPLAPFVARKAFLTKFEDQIYSPSEVNNDFTFTFAATDEIYHDVEIKYISDFAGIPFVIWLCCALPLVLAVLLLGGGWALKRRRG